MKMTTQNAKVRFKHQPFKRQPQKMIKHTQAIRWLNCLSVFDHFLGLALKGLRLMYCREKCVKIFHCTSFTIASLNIF